MQRKNLCYRNGRIVMIRSRFNRVPCSDKDLVFGRFRIAIGQMVKNSHHFECNFCNEVWVGWLVVKLLSTPKLIQTE